MNVLGCVLVIATVRVQTVTPKVAGPDRVNDGTTPKVTVTANGVSTLLSNATGSTTTVKGDVKTTTRMTTTSNSTICIPISLLICILLASLMLMH